MCYLCEIYADTNNYCLDDLDDVEFEDEDEKLDYLAWKEQNGL